MPQRLRLLETNNNRIGFIFCHKDLKLSFTNLNSLYTIILEIQ